MLPELRRGFVSPLLRPVQVCTKPAQLHPQTPPADQPGRSAGNERRPEPFRDHDNGPATELPRTKSRAAGHFEMM